MKFVSVLVLVVTVAVSLGRDVPKDSSDCRYKGEKICYGAVTKEVGSLVKVCKDGKVKWSKKAAVGAGYPVVGRDTGPGKDCLWYGQVGTHITRYHKYHQI